MTADAVAELEKSEIILNLSSGPAAMQLSSQSGEAPWVPPESQRETVGGPFSLLTWLIRGGATKQPAEPDGWRKPLEQGSIAPIYHPYRWYIDGER